jgi:hypothetical protein
MVIPALSSWTAIGAAIGAALVRVWRIRGLTLAWGMMVGGAGGSVGGLIGRLVFPEHDLAAVLGAAAAAVLAILIGRAEEHREGPGAV